MSFKKNVCMEDLLQKVSVLQKTNVPISEITWGELTDVFQIGQGAFGRVYKARWNDTEVAVKELIHPKPSPEALQDFRAEVNVMSSLRHPQIVLLLGASTKPPLLLVTEFMNGKSVWDQLRTTNRPLPRAQALRIALDTAKALSYLHSRGVMHRDLKSSNILLDHNMRAKLCDFGLSRVKGASASQEMTIGVGTAQWMAPEVVQSHHYGLKADIYSFGIILWELFTARIPFSSLRAMQVGFAVVSGRRPEIPRWLVQDPVVELMQNCWAQDPDRRPDTHHIIRQLQSILANTTPDPDTDHDTPSPGPSTPTPRTQMPPPPALTATSPRPGPYPSAAPSTPPDPKRVAERQRAAASFWKRNHMDPVDAELDLNGRPLNEGEAADLADAILYNPRLRSLSLGSPRRIPASPSPATPPPPSPPSPLPEPLVPPAGRYTPRPAPSGPAQLSVSSSATWHLFDTITAAQSLLRLDLRGDVLGGAGGEALASGLAGNEHLEKLVLSHNKLPIEALTFLCNALKFNRFLKDLHILHNDLGDQGAGLLADALKVNRSVRELKLRRNNCGDAGAGVLADMLRVNDGLQLLSLAANQLTDAACVPLADAIRFNSTLLKLTLEDNDIGSTGASLLADAIHLKPALIIIGPWGSRKYHDRMI